MKNLSWLLILLSPLLVTSCGSNAEKDKNTTSSSTLPAADALSYEIISEDKLNGIKISEIKFDTARLHDGTAGLLISFNMQVKPDAFDALKAENFSSYFIDLRCSSEGKSYYHKDELFKNPDKKKFLHMNKECFISSPGSRQFKISFPYRQMAMKEGEKEIELSIDAYTAKFEDDQSSLNVKMLENISSSPKGSTKIKLRVKAPKLYKASITVHKAKINTSKVKIDHFDYGKEGLPDMFWEVYCGNDYIYYSPVQKNKIEYLKKSSTPVFYCSAKDTINLAFLDYDNGPFNTQDELIGIWKMNVSSIKNKIDTFRFGNFEYLIVESKIEEAM